LIRILNFLLNIGSPQDWLNPAGPVASDQKDLFLFTLYICLAIFIIVGGFMLYSIIKFKAAPGDNEIPEQEHGSVKLEIGLMVVSTIVLAIIAIPNVKLLYKLAEPPRGSNPLQINVIGHQYWWEFEIPEYDVITANELTIPTNRAIEFNVSSVDVIHSFWVPRLGGKVDAVPGHDNYLWFQADEEGLYFGQCAELCGSSHAKMKFQVYAVENEEFLKWVEKEASPANLPTTEFAEEGKALFLTKMCITCHTVKGYQGAIGIIGPNLSHFASRKLLAGTWMENTEENLEAWMEDPSKFKPDNIMSLQGPMYMNENNALSQEEIRKIVAYLRELY